jgi:type I restriction enzyme, S subunit
MTRPSTQESESRLSEVTDLIQYGYTAKSATDLDGPKYLRITDIQNDNVDWSAVPHVVIEPHEFDRYRLVAGDIVFARTGATVGKSFLINDDPGNAVFASYLIRVRCSPDRLDPRYAALFFQSEDYWNQIREGAAGTGQPNFNGTKLGGLFIPLRPLRDQRRIVSELESLLVRSKSARWELARIPRLVERYKQAILAAAFSGDLTCEWRRRMGVSKPQRARLEALVAVPIRNGLSVRGSDDPPGIRSLRLSALHGRVVDLNDVRFLPIAVSQAERFLLFEGDVLVSRGNGTKSFVGIAALVPQVPQPTIFPDTAFRIRLATQRARPAWFTSIWNAPQVRKQIEDAAKTTAGIWKVSQGDLSQIELLLPSPEEQDEICKRIDVAFACIEKAASETSRAADLLDRWEQAILTKAFRGDLVAIQQLDKVGEEAVAR